MEETNKPRYRVTLQDGRTWDYSDDEFRNGRINEYLEANHKGKYQVYRMDEADPAQMQDDDQYLVTVGEGDKTRNWLYTGKEYNSGNIGGWLDKNGENYSVEKVRSYDDANIAMDEDYYRELQQKQIQAIDDFDTANREFMGQHKAEKALYDAGEGNYVEENYMENDARYNDLVNQKTDLIAALANNPITKDEYARQIKYSNDKIAEYEKIMAEMEEKNKFLNASSMNSGTDQENKTYKYYQQAEKLARDVAKIYAVETTKGAGNNKTGDYVRNYFKGGKDVLSDEDFWSRGLTEMARNLNVRDIIKDLEAKGLNLREASMEEIDKALQENPGAKELLVQFIRLGDAQARRAQDMAPGYSAGQVSTESLGYMAEFLLTGMVANGVGSAIRAGEGAVQSGFVRLLARELQQGSGEAIRATTARMVANAITKGGKIAPKAVGTLGKVAFKTLPKVAEGAYSAVLRPVEAGIFHTVLQPSTYASISEGLTRIDDTGHLVSAGDAIFTSVLDQIIENWSESVGGVVNEALFLPFRGIAAAGKAIGKATGAGGIQLGKATVEQWGRWLADNWASNVLHEAGFNGLFGEMGEEWIGNAVRVGFGLMSKEEFNDFAQINSQLDMAASFAPMTLFGLGSSARAAYKQNQAFQETAAKMLNIIDTISISDEEKKKVRELFEGVHTKKEMLDGLQPVMKYMVENSHSRTMPDGSIRSASITADEYRTLIEFAKSANAESVLRSAQVEYRNMQRDQKLKQLQDAQGDTEESKRITDTRTVDLPDGSQMNVDTVDIVTDEAGNDYYKVGTGSSQVVLKRKGSRTAQPVFMTQDELDAEIRKGTYKEKRQSVEQFLDSEIENDRKASEAVRMDQEKTDKRKEVQRLIDETGGVIHLGTEADPKDGIVGEVQADGVVVYFNDPVVINGHEGTMHKISFEEAGNALGLDMAVLTDDQQIQIQADKEKVNDEKKAAVSKVLMDGQFTKDGQAYIFKGMQALPDENGNVIVYAKDSSNNSTSVEMSFDELVAQIREDGAQAVEEAAAGAQASVTAQDPAHPVDFRGNPIPMKTDDQGNPTVDRQAFLKKDPEAYFKWNDQQRGGATGDSESFLQSLVDHYTKQANDAEKNRAASLDPEQRDAFEKERDEAQKFLDIYTGILNKYQAEAQFNQMMEEYNRQLVQYKAEMLDAQSQEEYDAAYNLWMETSEKMRQDQQAFRSTAEAIRLDNTVRMLNNAVATWNTDMEVRVVTEADVVQQMEADQCTPKEISDIKRGLAQIMTMRAAGRPASISGVHANGRVYLFAEGNSSAETARKTYHHERTHEVNERDPRGINMLVAAAPVEELQATVRKLCGSKFYDGAPASELADEIIAYAFEGNIDLPSSVAVQNRLRKAGASDNIISTVLKYYADRRTAGFSLPERLGNGNNNGSGSFRIGTDGTDQTGESGQMGGQGLRADGRGMQENAPVQPAAGESGEPAAAGVTEDQTREITTETGGDMDGEPIRFSVTAQAEGVGLGILKDDGNGNVALVHPDGRQFNAQNLLTADDLKSIPDTSFSYMMKDARRVKTVDDFNEWSFWNKYAQMLNAILVKGSAENGGFEALSSQWQWIAESVYKTVAINSDSQYGWSLDITRVCKKNEAVINAIAETQRRLGYGITPGQIMDIYDKTIEAGYQVPCPVCYVFSRYIRNGKYATIMINGQEKFGKYLVDPSTLSEEEKKQKVQEWLQRLDEVKKSNEANSKLISQANSDITELLDQIDELAQKITDPNSGLTDKERSRAREKVKALDAKYRAALNLVSQSSLDSWITQFAIHKVKVDGKEQWQLWEDTYKPFPAEMALDMRQTALVMRLYPGIQRFRNSRGAAAGKEIHFVANNDIGDMPLALGSQAATKDLAKPREMTDDEWQALLQEEEGDLKGGVKNLYRQAVEEKDPKVRKKILKAATKRFKAAHIYAQQQSLRGGQRMWSWSDNIERLGPDVFINLLQLEMLGGALQSYSKQLEGIKHVATMGGYVNGSLMGKGNGYREVNASEVEQADGQLYLKDGDYLLFEPGEKPEYRKTPVYLNPADNRYYVLEFDNVVGIEPFSKYVKNEATGDMEWHKGLFELNQMLDKAGNIIVGMNDLHVRMAMADGRIFFIIPWHSSGANNHILSQMYNLLKVEYDVRKSQDYTMVQEEKRFNAPGETVEETETDTENEDEAKEESTSSIKPEVIRFWEDHYNNAREYPGYGQVAGKDFACGIEGGVKSGNNGQLDATQLHYRELRDAIFVGIKIDTGRKDKNGKPITKVVNVEQVRPDWYNEIMNDEFLSQALRKVRGTVTDLGFMTSGDKKYIYPYEYWDEESTYDTADVNAARYLEYCRRLGYKPKFCGKLDDKATAEGKDFGNFADDRGYWKLLIDRRMYNTSGRFQDLTPVTAEKWTPDLIDPEKTAKEFTITRVANDEGTNSVVDATIEKEQAREGGIARVDYGMTFEEAVSNYSMALNDWKKFQATLTSEEKARFRINEEKRIQDQERQAEIDEAVAYVTGRQVPEADMSDVESVARFSVLTPENAETDDDRLALESFANGKTTKVYRSMQVVNIDGQDYALPPMAAKIEGKWVQGLRINEDGTLEPTILRADEHPELASDKGFFMLDKGNGKKVPAAYNPYWHTAFGMLNDQFGEAQDRPNLITVEGEIPDFILERKDDERHRSDKAHDPEGERPWKAGIITGSISGRRGVVLSRYFRGVRVIPDETVAQNIYDQIKGKVDVMPTNVVPPAVRQELEKLGMKFVKTDNKNMLLEGPHEGDQYTWWYGKNQEANRTKGFKDRAKKAGVTLEQWLKDNGRTGQIDQAKVRKYDQGQAKRNAGKKTGAKFRITPEQDEAFRKAYEAGDKDTASRMVRDAFKAAFPDTKVVDENGEPMVVYHTGSFASKGNYVANKPIHFGTKAAALDRARRLFYENSWTIDVIQTRDYKYNWEAEPFFDLYDPDTIEYQEIEKLHNSQPKYNTKEEAQAAGDEAFGKYLPNYKETVEGLKEGDVRGIFTDLDIRMTKSYLNLENPEKVVDAFDDYGWKKEFNRVKNTDIDGFIYENEVEDRGSVSFVAFSPSQIKSAEPFTFDDKGDLIPLSERFNPSNNDIRFSIIGERGAMNDKSAEGLARLDNLDVAREMESKLNPDWNAKNDDNALKIKVATGWERGADGKWRYEIPDGNIRENPKFKRTEWEVDGSIRYEYTGTLYDLYDAPELYSVYPFLKDLTVEINPYAEGNEGGFFSKAAELIKVVSNYTRWIEPEHSERFKELEAKLMDAFDAAEAEGKDLLVAEAEWEATEEGKEFFDLSQKEKGHFEAGFPEYERKGSARKILVHEIQHAIQYYEGFSIGGSQRNPNYKRLGGEVESRNVSGRLNMTPEQRRNSLLSSTEDVAREDQIFIYDSLNSSNAARFSITPEMDQQYMDAVNSNDMAKAQAMVDQAAEAAMPNSQVRDEDGKLLHMFHGTRADEKFWIFDTKGDLSDDNSNIGSHFGPKTTADEFSKDNQYDVYLNLKKVWEAPFDFFADNWNNAYLEALIDLKNSCENPDAQEIFDRIYDVYPILATYDLDDIVVIEEFDNDEGLEEMEERTNKAGVKFEVPKHHIEHRNAMVNIMLDMMEAEGYDGIAYENWYEGEENNLCYIALDPNQIKLADPVTYDNDGKVIPLSERFKEENNDVRFSVANKSQQIFVSNAMQAVESLNMAKATPAQWLGMIQSKGGLKAGEDKWLGLSDWLKESDKKTLTRSEILDFIEENQIRIEEVKYGSFQDFSFMDEKYPGFSKAFEPSADMSGELTVALKNMAEARDFYEKYGNEDPSIADDGDYLVLAYKLVSENIDEDLIPVKPVNETRESYTTKGLDNKREIALTVPTIDPYNEDDDIHFGDAGNGRAIAWIRFGETKTSASNNGIESRRIKDEIEKKYGTTRTNESMSPEDIAKNEFADFIYRNSTSYARNFAYDTFTELGDKGAEAKAIFDKMVKDNSDEKRVLVIDEIQSKRHQDGRERGYAVSREEYAKILEEFRSFKKEMHAKYGEQSVPSDWDFDARVRFNEFRDKTSAYQDLDKKGVPDAPFEKNWHELAFKRMLRLAAEEGYDKVAWTNGEMQSERYDLGDRIDGLVYTKVGENLYDVNIILPNGSVRELSDGPLTLEEIKADAGSHIANMVANNEGREADEYRSKVMYDTEGYNGTPKVVEGTDLRVGGEGMKGFYDKMLPAFANKYCKKWGTKVQDIDLPDLENKTGWHSIDITPEMKQSVMGGQTMFRVNTREEVRQEMNDIKAAAVNDGTFMTYNGKPTNLNEEQWLMVRTKNFKEWFGDWENDPENASKAVDENGEPKVLYRGDAKRITTFAEQYSGNEHGKGYYFTEDYDYAEEYSGEDGDVMEAFLNMRRPLSLASIRKGTANDFLDAVKEKFGVSLKNMDYTWSVDLGSKVAMAMGHELEEYDLYDSAEAESLDEIEINDRAYISADGWDEEGGLNDLARELGYDGIIADVFNAYTEGLEYIAFNPNQIKSATDNNGDFDPDNNDIRYRLELGNKTAEKGGRYYEDEQGNIDLVTLSNSVFDALGITPRPFRITESMANHVYEQHKGELNLTSPEDAAQVIMDIMLNFDHVRKDPHEEEGAYIFSVEDGRRKVARRNVVLTLSSFNEEYLGIKTSGHFPMQSLKKNPSLWVKGANETLPAATTTASVTSAPSLQGGKIESRTSDSSEGLSESKDTNSSDNSKGRDAKLRITPAQDTEFRQAYENNDTETAMRLVKDAFKAAFPNTKVVDDNGEPLVVYHGTTDQSINVFDKGYFASNKNVADWFTLDWLEKPGKVYETFLNIENPLEFDAVGDNWDQIAVPKEVAKQLGILEDTEAYDETSPKELFDEEGFILTSTDKIEESVRKSNNKYDGAIIRRVYETDNSNIITDDFVPIYSNQIKSAEPFTFDDNGELIPLSQRFNPESNDIRFSTSVKPNENYDGEHTGKYSYFGPKPENKIQKDMLDYIMMCINDGEDIPSDAIGYIYNYIDDPVEGEAEGWNEKDANIFNEDMFRTADKQSYIDKINSPAFKKWFGKSVVVNEDGTPKVVYKGTRDGAVNIFNTEYGSYFTDNYNVADDYAYYDNDYGRDDEDAKVYEVYLRLENPFVIDANYREWKNLPSEINGIDSGRHSTNGWVEYIKSHPELGYDGVIFKNVIDGYGPSYAAYNTDYVIFDPNQAKSATDNNGEFSRENDDIRFSFMGQKGMQNLELAGESSVRMDNLNIAIDMENAGKDPLTIKIATGWEKGMDGKWRYEMDDVKLSKSWYSRFGHQPANNSVSRISDVLEDNEAAQTLFKAYPQIADMKVKAYRNGRTTERGNYSSDTNTMELNLFQYNSLIPMERAANIESTLIHELQHFIQTIEGFGQGTNPDEAYWRIRKRNEAELEKLNKRKFDLWYDNKDPEIEAAKAKVLDTWRRFEPLQWTEEWKAWKAEGKDMDDFKGEVMIPSEEQEKLPEYKAWRQADQEEDAVRDRKAMENPEYREILARIDELNQEALDNALEEYAAATGEVEARNAESRRKMSSYQKRHKLAVSTEDMPRSRQYVVMGDSKDQAKKDRYATEGMDLDNIPGTMMNIYDNLSEESRDAVVRMVPEFGYDFSKAVQKYFGDMLGKDLDQTETDAANEMRDVLRDELGLGSLSTSDALWYMWKEDHPDTGIFGVAENIVKAEETGNTEADREAERKYGKAARFSIYESMRAGSAAEMYSKATSYWLNRLKEGFVDMNESVNDLVDAIETATKSKAQSFEDVRLALNQQSSKGLAAMNKYTADFLEPMWDAIGEIMKAGDVTMDDVSRYVMLKHGLERNDKLAQRDAIRDYQEEYDAEVGRINADPNMTQADKAVALVKAAQKFQKRKLNVKAGTDAKYKEYRKNDYSGLTTLYSEYPGLQPREYYNSEEQYNAAMRRARKPKYKDVAAMEAAAEQEVKDFENNVGTANTDNLWKKINAATKETVRSQYEANMISSEVYHTLLGQFDFYVPLRGFKDTEADDIWSYYGKNQGGNYTHAVMEAKGRKSEAENPFYWIGTMASSAITENVKNKAKLALYYFISNRPGQDLAQIKEMWYEYDPVESQIQGRKVFKAAYPPLTENLDSQAAKDAYDAWEKDLRDKAKQKLAYHRTAKLNVSDDVKFIDSNQKPEHVVKVKVRGKDQAIIINGNPRAAQAINGLLNVETAKDYQKVFGGVLRWMSAVNTSYNPEFWISNFERDFLYSIMAADIKGYGAKDLMSNMVNPGRIMKMMKAYEDGTLGNSREEQYYREFAENGAITGYSVIVGNEEWEKRIKKHLDPSLWQKAKESGFLKFWQNLGEAVEQMTRFAAYVTERENGKDITDSVNAAKELTVNFNRKGSGKAISWSEVERLRTRDGKPLNKAQKTAVFMLGLIPAYGRRMIMFFNAATQGLYNMWNLAKMKTGRKKFWGWMAGYFTVGMLQAIIHSVTDDDDDYLDMPDYTRRNNIMLGGGGVYLKWAMPQEARVFYQIGDIFVNQARGREPNRGIGKEIFSVLTEVLPVSGGDNGMGYLPSLAQPFVELVINKDFTGSRIYDDLKFMSKEERQMTARSSKALPQTNPVYIGLARGINTVTGGNRYDAGFFNIPAEAIQHITESLGGGLLTTGGKFVDMVLGAVDLATGGNVTGEGLTVRRTPFINRFMVLNSESTRNSHTSELWYYYKGVAEHSKTKMNAMKEEGRDSALDKFTASKEYEIMKLYERYKKRDKTWTDKIKVEEDPKEVKRLKREQDEYRREMIEEISNL